MKAFRFAASSSETDPRTPQLWPLGCCGILEDGSDLIAYFEAEVDLPFEGSWEDADSSDYVAAYQASLQPIDLGPLVVAPSHSRVALSAWQRPLWLDPGMAFGSGHHETTAMALEALIDVDPFGLDVLDVGAGSGILAIAADLLGARSSRGLDNDPVTVSVAADNARRNGSRARFVLGVLDEAVPSGAADVVVANLYAELHRTLLAQYARVLRPGGVVLMTGILGDRHQAVWEALPPSLEATGTRRRGEWMLLSARLRPKAPAR